MKALLFTSTNCKACPAMKQNLAKAGIPYDEMNVDVRENWAIAGLYRVRALPTLVVVEGGKPVESLPGSWPLPELLKLKEKRAL